MRITVTSEMTALSDVHTVIFGMNVLKLDRPLLLLPGEVVGKAGHLVKVEAGAVGHPGGGQGPAGPSGGPSGGAPTGGYPGGAPGFSGSAADAHGTGNNQCGSSFYGPAYGGGVSHQEIGAGVSQYSNATGYPSSVASGGNLGPGLSLGYSVSGAGRQGDGGLLPEALRGDDGRDRCTKCNKLLRHYRWRP